MTLFNRKHSQTLTGYETRLGRISAFLLLVVIAITGIFPLLYVLNSSFRSNPAIASTPWGLATHPVGAAYRIVFDQLLLPAPLINSLVSSLSALGLLWILGGMAAYGCVMTRFAAKTPALLLIVASVLIPFQAILFPLFKTMLSLDLINSYFGLILTYVGFGLPLTTLLFAAYFRRLPAGVIEAARVDGASTARILFQIVLPMSLPVVAITGIFNFLWTWNEFLLPLVLLQDPSKQTFVERLALIPDRYMTNQNEIAASAVIGIIPILFVYMLAQRFIIRSVTGGALKG